MMAAPLPLDSPALRVLVRVREQLRDIQRALSSDDHEAGQDVAECIEILDDAIVEELRVLPPG